MRWMFATFTLLLACASNATATGLVIPEDKKLPPLAMLNHKVDIAIDDQVAVTRIEQTFRNHTDRDLEATYIFPIPKGASVRKFSMWLGAKEVPGELITADKARGIYTDLVQRTVNPSLLDYMGNNLLRLRVFRVPAKGDQKISISYTSVAVSDQGLIEYVYPLKTDGKAVSTLEKFSLTVHVKSQHPLQNIYSPTHGITMSRPNEREAIIGFEKDQALLDRDFLLYYTAGTKDVGITTLTHRPIADANGYFMMLVSPRAELAKAQEVPRDMIFVLDTSGSMRGKRMTQAQNALKICLKNLTPKDRFGLINFATTVNKYTEAVKDATKENIEAAKKWVDDLEATGGTAIDDALAAAIGMRSNDDSRAFTIVFFTDGQPTIGETDIDKILQNAAKKNTANTRIFTFGVGDDVNASLLDQLADSTRALSTYVRETEDIEVKVTSLYSKISNPVLTNLKLTVGEGISINEVYPPQLPDLFHGSQLVVLGRYTGKGEVAIKLTGTVGKETKEFVYNLKFPEKSAEDKAFVEDLWARRKVGYLLDQIRANGEKKELVEEVVTLAKRYGITTPYTSYLLVPDGAVPIAGAPIRKDLPNVGFQAGGGAPPPALKSDKAGGAPVPVSEFIKKAQEKAGEGSSARDKQNAKDLDSVPTGDAKGDAYITGLQLAKERWLNYRQAKDELRKGNLEGVQAGKLGVEIGVDCKGLCNQSRISPNAQRWIGNRNCLEVGGVWIDENYEAKMKTIAVKATSEAYFRILERHPSVRDVFRIGSHLVWVTPSGAALVIDAGSGAETMPDADIDALFVAKK